MNTNTNTNEQINLSDIAFLQAYLIGVFEFEGECEKNFKYTEWYLDQKVSKELKQIYMDYLKIKGATCDCDVINKIDLRDESDFDHLIKHE
ncbi:hypothetical protein BMS3Abin03_00980 [bacterium BMS3Abin03]|nr:hypothetical protein BMS3Abin03_00980 [bacterium BMS3Abin03]